MGRFLAVDTETTGLDLRAEDRVFAISACDDQGELWYWSWPVDPFTREVEYDQHALDDVVELIANYDDLVFHNARFDLLGLSLISERMRKLVSIRIAEHRVWDTMILAHAEDNNASLDLKELSRAYLGIDRSDESKLHDEVVSCRRWAKANGWPVRPNQVKADYWLPAARRYVDLAYATKHHEDLCAIYALKDAECTMRLFLLLLDWYREHPEVQPHVLLEIKLIRVLWDMESTGITIHPRRAKRELAHYQEAQEEARRVANAVTPVNIDSIVSLRTALYEVLELPVLSSRKTGAAVDKYTLGALGKFLVADTDGSASHKLKFVEAVSRYKRYATAAAYVKGYLDRMIVHDGYRLYPRFNQCGTVTTRLSCQNPNAQNVGKGWELEEGVVDMQLRCIFGPRNGMTWYALDYSQLQLRIFAYASGESSMIQALEHGWDFHRYVASRIFNTGDPSSHQRRIAKNVNFALIFGGGERKVDSTAGMPGAYNLFRGQFPNVDRYMQAVSRQVRRCGYVTTLGGIRLRVPQDRPYVGVNYIVQGTEGEIVKRAMYDCSWVGAGIQLIMQVHDELVFETYADMDLDRIFHIASILERAGESVGVVTPVDIKVIKDNWSNGEPLLQKEMSHERIRISRTDVGKNERSVAR